jgi:hypothetical protein
MSTKFRIFTGNHATPARYVRANGSRPIGQFNLVRNVRQTAPRDVLVMVWRTNPASNRLECRWMTEQSGATDEGVSCYGLFRQAA